jgi:hypothetical protein
VIRLELTFFPVLFLLVGCGSPVDGDPQPRVGRGQAAPAATARASTAAPASTAASRSERYPVAREEVEARRLRAILQADPDPAARRAAVDAYANQTADADELLRTATSDPDPLVRRWAALALERQARADADLAAALEQAAISEPDRAVRSALERALRRARG